MGFSVNNAPQGVTLTTEQRAANAPLVDMLRGQVSVFAVHAIKGRLLTASLVKSARKERSAYSDGRSAKNVVLVPTHLAQNRQSVLLVEEALFR